MGNLSSRVVSVVPLEPRVFCSAGDADLSFAPRGSRDLGIAGQFSDFARTPAGGHVVTIQRQFTQSGGYTDEYDGTYVPITRTNLPYDAFRLNADGSVDRTFGRNGYADTPLDNVMAARVLADGSTLLFGYAGNQYGDVSTGTPTVVRLTAAGKLDSTFGNNGSAAIDPSLLAGVKILDTHLADDGSLTLLLDPDGRFMTGRAYVRRFTPGGSADAAFGSAGRAEVASRGRLVNAAAIAVDNAGRVYVAGNVLNLAQTASYGGGVIRLTAAGVADETFARSGVAINDRIKNVSVQDIALMNDGGFVLLGSRSVTETVQNGPNSTYIDHTYSVFVRFKADGTYPVQFGNRGVSQIETGAPSPGEDLRLHVGPDDSLLAVSGDRMVRVTGPRGRYDDVFGVVLVRSDFIDAADADRIVTLGGRKLRAIQAGADGPRGPVFVRDRTLYFAGSDLNDSFNFYDDEVVANGIGRVITPGDFNRVIVYGQGGDDQISIAASYRRGVYAFGGDGNDRIDIASGRAFLYGENGRDTLQLVAGGYGTGGGAVMDGGAGADRILAGNYADTIYAGSGDDRIYAYGGNDVIYANAGDDQIDAGEGADTVDGGSGMDISDDDDDDFPTSIETLV